MQNYPADRARSTEDEEIGELIDLLDGNVSTLFFAFHSLFLSIAIFVGSPQIVTGIIVS